MGVLRRGVPARVARRRRPRWARRSRSRGRARVGGRALSRPRLLDLALTDGGGDPLGDPRAARGARRARRRDARARRRHLPGCLPQPAGGPVPPGRRSRGWARRDDRDRVPPGWPAGPADAPRRSIRRRVDRSHAHLRRRPLGETRARRGDADPRRCHGDGVLHGMADVRPAAELGDAAGGVLVDPREHPELGLVRRRLDPSRTSRSRWS